MTKVSVVVLADTGTHEALGRVANAFELAKELKESNDEVELVFDGAGTKWVPDLRKPDHKLRGLYVSVQDRVSGACEYCAGAFGVKEAVKAARVPLLGEFDGHPSLRRRITQGYQVITF